MTDDTTGLDEQIVWMRAAGHWLELATSGPDTGLKHCMAILDSLERLRRAEKLLSVAGCPACDGSGSFPDPYDGEETQCQWCDEMREFREQPNG